MPGQEVGASDSQLSPALARAMVRSLVRGTTISEGVRYIHVGHSNWLLAQKELLTEIAEDGHADTKFVRGAYGAGKSHFLAMVQDLARTLSWATSHIECKVDGVQIDRFETLYPRIVGKLRTSDTSEVDNDTGLPVDPARSLLEKWARDQIKRAGIREGGLVRPFDAEIRLYHQLEKGLFRSGLPPDFIRALGGFAGAFLARDLETMSSMCGWISGIKERATLSDPYLGKSATSAGRYTSVLLRPISKNTARDAMRGLLWLVRSAGYSGLVLCIDEIEELAKLGSKKRQDQALQALREYVDHAGGEGGFRNLCMYLAATPEMFEGEDYFPRYDALATRIQPIGPEINWRSPVIDLDRTPLDKKEMTQVAEKICAVHQVAYGNLGTSILTNELISELLKKVQEARFRIAKPRLLARVLVDALERARHDGSQKTLPDVEKMVSVAASQIIRGVEEESERD
jgi:P-loop Domain of unknown function (DUF2791)